MGNTSMGMRRVAARTYAALQQFEETCHAAEQKVASALQSRKQKGVQVHEKTKGQKLHENKREKAIIEEKNMDLFCTFVVARLPPS